MNNYRIESHPIVKKQSKKHITFFFEDKKYIAREGEMISTALFANGIKVFGYYHKDNSPQGIFCANGQCAQCLVIADGNAVKSCVTEIKEGMKIYQVKGLPELPLEDTPLHLKNPDIIEYEPDVFIMGGGPAGLSAAAELAGTDLKVIIADDKNELGGKLSLQTHNFFGSAKECNAGVRGMDIGRILIDKVKDAKNIEIWTSSPVVGTFSDKKLGIVRNERFVFVKPKVFLVAAGAREKTIAFPGSDLPGVYGAGALQTLINRDLVKAADRLFIVGGGNVGLITAYHALQAGIKVLGLVEALPECGGYKVHLDKIKRLGIPVWTSHTVMKAEGNGVLESVTIAKLDEKFNVIEGTEFKFKVDTLLIAVGLSPVDEIKKQAEQFGIKTFAAGDADVIAEASAAIFSGKITGREILKFMGYKTNIPQNWYNMLDILRGKHGETKELKRRSVKSKSGIYPIIRCLQEIPCNPCSESCIARSVNINSESMMQTPEFEGICGGCTRCVSICPGLAITLVDENYDSSGKKALVILPWEMPEDTVKIGEIKTTVGLDGKIIGQGKIIAIKNSEWQDRRRLLYVETPLSEAKLVAGIMLYQPEKGIKPDSDSKTNNDDEIIICKCERVTKKQIKEKIASGCRDINALKAELRIGMGACGGKTCLNLIQGIFREMGISKNEITQHVIRPFEMEVSLNSFLNIEEK